MTETTASFNKVHIAVVGGGLVGLLASLRLAQACKTRGEKLSLIAPVQTSEDGRTTAMLMPTVETLRELGLWDPVEAASAPLRTMRLVDGSKRLIRAPVADFRSSEVGLEAFGYNVPNAQMIALLETALENHPAVTRHDALLEEATYEADGMVLKLSNGEILHAGLAVAADGRHSLLRQAAGITVRQWSYPQSAIVLSFSHSLPHQGISTEFHTETGPFTQVPLPATAKSKHRSSLVWVVRPEEVDGILALSGEDLSAQIEDRLQSAFGKVTVEDSPQVFDLSGMTARSFARNRVALVGESAHVFPPIGAQGFNLGVRDVNDLLSVILNASGDWGAPALLGRYNLMRAADVHIRTSGVDLMNRSLLTDFLPVQLARAAGIAALGNISFLRKAAMRHGLGSGTGPSAGGPFRGPFSGPASSGFRFWGRDRGARGPSR